ncbi:MAG: hypothetical protein JWR85_3109 [Marmoricola sp.]|nr:hypothetical protein [Marmoricola sp.]
MHLRHTGDVHRGANGEPTMSSMADLCASIMVVLGTAWVVRRIMDGPAPQPLTAVGRRCWVFLSLLSSVAMDGVLAGAGLIAWRSAAIPAAMLGIWLVLCRMMVRPRRDAGSAVIARLSPATLALTGAVILALWISVNPMGGEPPNKAVASTTAVRGPVHTPTPSKVAQVEPPVSPSNVPATSPGATNPGTANPGTANPSAANPSAANLGSSPVASTGERETGERETGERAAAQPQSPAAAGSRRGAGPGIVMATRGAIVYVGDNGRLTANTGATSSSGAVALGVEGSDLQSGDSGDVKAATRAQRTAARQGAAARQGGQPVGHENSTLGELAKRGKGPRGTAVSGFEDHSVSVLGDDQIVTYDDSNVFIDRKGLINANTGDTDSSGLNAVDVGGSTVRAGNSGDSEGGGGEEAEEEATGLPPAPSDERKLPDRGATSRTTAPTPAGTDEGDAEQGGGGSAGVRSGRGQSSGTVTDEGASIATGKNAFVVGADGVDDVSIRSHGRNDIVTYDDSNVAIDGEGQVNAQIGDSDTGGGVVMGIHDSDVRAGCEGDLCYSANPAVTLAAQLLGSGVHLTPAQRRQLLDFVTHEYTSGQSLRENATTRQRGRSGPR